VAFGKKTGGKKTIETFETISVIITSSARPCLIKFARDLHRAELEELQEISQAQFSTAPHDHQIPGPQADSSRFRPHLCSDPSILGFKASKLLLLQL
jgi:hypothetical protein